MANLIILLLVGILILVSYLFYLMKKTRMAKHEWYWRVIQVILIIFITGVLANEIIQPLIFPRISNIEITPLFIQSVSPDSDADEIDYYAVFNVKYKILTPLFLKDRKIDLRIPGGATQNIEWIFNLQEYNPYYEILVESPDQYHSSAKLGGVLPIKIKANALNIKEIEVNFIIREKMDTLNRHMGISDRFWWTDTKINPLSSMRDLYAQSNTEMIGYGIKTPTNIPFKFRIIKVENLANLKINGLRLEVGEYTDTICLENLEMNKMYNRYISIDLDPGETKTLLLVNREELDLYKYYPSIKFSGREGNCIVYNEVYQRLLKEL